MLGARRLLRGTVYYYEDGCRSDAQRWTDEAFRDFVIA